MRSRGIEVSWYGGARGGSPEFRALDEPQLRDSFL